MCPSAQFFEVDLPQVSKKKIDLVDAVIPDKEKVNSSARDGTMGCCDVLQTPRMHTSSLDLHSELCSGTGAQQLQR